MRESKLSSRLLDWYDTHARTLPWRTGPAQGKAGARPDPYRVWLSEVMLQQTTVATVGGYFARFTALWPSVADLAAARDADVMAAWAGLGYYARARNLLKCARVVAADHGGMFPRTRDGLQALPGIGPYTSAAIVAIAFDLPETVVDGNVERVMARLFAVTEPLPKSKPQITALAARLTPPVRPGDYAQAVMDLGATVCTPRNPACGTCPWQSDCRGRAQGIAGDLPAKTPKKPKPTRYGTAYLARRTDGHWLLETRPPRGLLGGMLGWPGSDWAETRTPINTPPLAANWRALPGEVRHTFTHFHLILTVQVAELPMTAMPETDTPKWQALTPAELPTVMRKAHDLASRALASL